MSEKQGFSVVYNDESIYSAVTQPKPCSLWITIQHSTYKNKTKMQRANPLKDLRRRDTTPTKYTGIYENVYLAPTVTSTTL